MPTTVQVVRAAPIGPTVVQVKRVGSSVQVIRPAAPAPKVLVKNVGQPGPPGPAGPAGAPGAVQKVSNVAPDGSGNVDLSPVFTPQANLPINPKDKAYGAKGDSVALVVTTHYVDSANGVNLGSSAIAQGAGSAAFTSAMVGKTILVAGANSGATYVGTVTAYTPAASPAPAYFTVASPVPSAVTNGAAMLAMTDDTAAIDAAHAAARASGRPVQYPAGIFYYAGNGTYNHPIRGAGALATKIVMPPGKSLIVSPPGPTVTTILDVEGITTVGGALVRLTFTAAQTQEKMHPFRVFDCRGENPNGGGNGNVWISSLSGNECYWLIRGLVTWDAASEALGNIAVALLNVQGGNDIHIDALGANFVAKLGAMNNTRLSGSLIRRPYTSFPRTDIWIVPNPTGAIQGNCVNAEIADWEFAPDNLSVANDYRVLIADEDTTTGANFANRQPAWTTVSNQSVAGLVIRDFYMSQGSTTNTTGRLVYSTTPKIFNPIITDGVFQNAKPKYLIEFIPGAIPVPDNLNNGYLPGATTAGRFGPFSLTGSDSPPLSSMAVSNAVGYGQVIERDSPLLVQVDQQRGMGAGDATAGFTILASDATTGFILVGTGSPLSTTKTQVTDALGGTDAWEISTTNADTAVDAYRWTAAAGSYPVGRVINLEFDVQAGATNPSPGMHLRVRNATTATQIHYERNYPALPGEWVRHRASFVPRTNGEVLQVFFASSGAAGTFRVGRFRAYVGREPVQSTPAFPFATTATTAPAAGGAGALPATPAGYMTVYINGTARKIPYY